MKKKLIISGIIIVLIIVATILYSHFIGTKGLIINEYQVVNEKVPESFNGLKIVHFSDMFYGTTFNEKDLNKLVKKINEYNPDIVVFTGNLVSNNDIKSEKVIASLNKIEAKLGCFYVSGNKDNEKSSMILNKTNFINLDNTNKLIYYKGNEPINLIGYGKDVLNEYDYYTILFTHNPENSKKLNSNLVLAGKTMGGLIRLPINKDIFGDNNYKTNYIKEKNKEIYISYGLGTNEFEFRLFNHPSINVYRLYNN
ncbi:MAG: metallophosphoesterase [Bacilli bacterium]|nr:metallophosphoesterase [Bacilli bacterium]